MKDCQVMKICPGPLKTSILALEKSSCFGDYELCAVSVSAHWVLGCCLVFSLATLLRCF